MTLEQRVESKIKELIKLANEIYGRNFEVPAIKYTLNGKVSGKAHCSKNVVDFNRVFLAENTEQFIKQTVTHEVSHIISYLVFGTVAHDKYWKSVMIKFGVEPKRCHNYSTENVKVRKVQRVLYKCKCRDKIEVSVIRHNKIVSGKMHYKCNTCKQRIVAVA